MAFSETPSGANTCFLISQSIATIPTRYDDTETLGFPLRNKEMLRSEP